MGGVSGMMEGVADLERRVVMLLLPLAGAAVVMVASQGEGCS